MKRIKVGEIDNKDIIRRIAESKKDLDNSIPVIKALIGRFDDEILSDIITDGSNTRNELETAMLSDIEKLSSVIMKDEFRNKLKYALSNFDDVSRIMVKAVNSVSDIIPIQNWCVENNTARIKNYNKIIEEESSIYITEQKGIELYQKLEEIVKELNYINSISKSYNIMAVSCPPVHRGVISLDANGKYNINGVLTANIVKEVYK